MPLTIFFLFIGSSLVCIVNPISGSRNMASFYIDIHNQGFYQKFGNIKKPPGFYPVLICYGFMSNECLVNDLFVSVV